MVQGSVTRAATALNISQPAVSKHLKLMEHDVGFSLFARAGNHLEPTQEARALFEQVEQVYAGMDSLSRFAEDLRDNRIGALTVAAMPLISQNWLPRVLGDFARDHPNVSLSVPVRSTDWIINAVAAGRANIGLALARGRAVGIHAEPLMELPLVAVFKPGHRFSRRDRIDLDDLSGENLITLSNFDRWPLELNDALTVRGIRPNRKLEVFTTHIACKFALQGAGVAIVDALSALDFVSEGIGIASLRTEIGFSVELIRPKHRTETRLANDVRLLITAAAEMTSSELGTGMIVHKRDNHDLTGR